MLFRKRLAPQQRTVTYSLRISSSFSLASVSSFAVFFFFFFQAEDGIRDPLVTGVQTCALPILPLYGDVAKFLGQSHTVYSPTFTVGGTAPWNEEYFFQIADVWKDAKLQRWTPWRELMPHLRRRWMRPLTDYHFGVQAQGLADIIANGGYGAIGSHGHAHGIVSH